MIWKAVLVGLLAAFAFVWVYVRLAPVDRQAAHGISLPSGPAGAATGMGSHTAIVDVTDPAATLARLDAIALATPRTQRLAGDADTGRVTYLTRSAFWGFPDFTTIEARPDAGQIVLHGRLRFGRKDFGVNRARIETWLAALDAQG